MSRKGNGILSFHSSPCAPAVLAVLLAGCAGHHAEPAGDAKPVEQRSFSTPEDAVQALVAALKAEDRPGLAAIFGPDSEALISSGDPVADRAARDRFLEAYAQRSRLEKVGDSQVILDVGDVDWPFPIPVAKDEAGWFFDTESGMEEVINRRIGDNELSTIQVVLAFVDAEREYAFQDYDGDGIAEYAQKFLSTPGTKDGLFWRTEPGDRPSPLGLLVAQAVTEGYTRTTADGAPSPYHGYFFRILKAQGEHANGGAFEYVAGQNMIGGFACVAYPAEYGVSGIKTFVVNHDGVVYEKDLGNETRAAGERMMLYDPDSSWTKSPQ